MATSHTPGPWRLNLCDLWIIEDAKGRRVAEMRNDCGPTAPTRKANDERDSICRANAAFIVEACNSHDELLRACKLALRDAENHIYVRYGRRQPLTDAALAELQPVRDAIYKATGLPTIR